MRDGDALWERDSVCFFHEEYNWPLLACLLFVASHNNNALHVLDFGGALGSTYMQHRKALSGLKECSWNIVEQEHFVQCGKQEFQTETLRFFESMEDCLAQCHINLVLFSGVLSYVENSYDLLVRATESSSAVLIDRTPFSERGERICVQKVSDSIYKASYPCRFLDRSKVEKVLSSDGRILLPWFRSSIDPSSFWGVLSVKERDLRMYRG